MRTVRTKRFGRGWRVLIDFECLIFRYGFVIGNFVLFFLFFQLNLGKLGRGMV